RAASLGARRPRDQEEAAPGTLTAGRSGPPATTTEVARRSSLPGAIAIARRLHPLGLARHLRVVGRVGHVAEPVCEVALVQGEQRLERVGCLVDRRMDITALRKA